MKAVKTPCAAKAVEPDTGVECTQPQSRTSLRQLGAKHSESRADFYEYLRHVQRLLQSTTLENDIEQRRRH
jgi:hypothetical protein